MEFTVEEMNLMCIYDVSDRRRLISGIRESLPDIYEPELRELTLQVLSRLEGMSDKAFAALDFIVTDDFGEEV